jgi:bla regulator protein BlaR1
MTSLLNHLWQSTLFAVLAGLLTLILKRNSARTRYWLWFAASVKFLIPFSLLVDAGSRVEWRTAPAMVQPAVSISMEQVFTAPAMILDAPEVARHEANYWPVVLGGLWFCGFAAVLVSWTRQWRRILIALRAATPYNMPLPMKTMVSPTPLEPGVFGVFRPVLLLPEGIAERLMPDQLEAIVAHELCHVRSRDNLAAAVHMLVEAIFWFHPLVWWIGKRLVDERERACDEEVLRLGNEPEVYAESILKVCEFYLESPLDCVSGITGSNLRKRIQNIMSNRVSQELSSGRKLLLAVAGTAVVTVPIMIGVLNAPRMRAQSQGASGLEFEVASVKPHKPQPGPLSVSTSVENGRLNYTNVTLKNCIRQAYRLRPYQVSGGPAWVADDRYDIVAKSESPADRAQVMRMLQTLLADRFKLKFHIETKEMPVYSLVVAKNGLRIKEANDDGNGTQIDGDPRHPLVARNISMAGFAGTLSRLQELDRPVIDATGLKGVFNFTLDYSSDAAAPSDNAGPSIFTALTEQLGLKLEAGKGPVDILVIDHVERLTGDEQAFFRNAIYSPQAFDVASIKPAPHDATERGVTQKPGGRLSTSNATVRQLVYLAYQVMPVQVSGGPDWVGSAGFDIEAKPAGSTPDRKQFRQMVQTLLADRFQLKFHMETKQLPIYELVVGKRGAKLTEDKSESLEVGMRNLRGELQGDKATMPMLAGSLTRVLQRQVVDETGLKGAYSFRLKFLPDQVGPRPDDGGAPDNDGASIFTVLQEQLGLNLRAGRGPVEVFVIDSAEKPSAN